MLLTDVISKGICKILDEDGNILGPGIYPLSEDCELVNTYENIKGTCSNETETILMSEGCLKDIFEQRNFIQDTLLHLIYYSCRENLVFQYAFFWEDINFRRNKTYYLLKEKFEKKKKNLTRLAPVELIYEKFNIKTRLAFENTLHRYPWVCSLRSTGPSPIHRCAVNLLSIPPKPTVVVGAAHCTYLCKDGARELSACCCSFGPEDCRENIARCGDDPGVVEMTEDDSIILCGEWDSSQATMNVSGEGYNVKLPVLEIVRHPGFNPAKGPIGGNDIVVFKVDDSEMQNNITETLQLWPACLPPPKSEIPLNGIHTGWSKPPPFPFIRSQAPGYGPYYNDFYKQWHYKMDIQSTCEDPKDSALCGGPLIFPSNSSYPPGTVCAKEFTRESCFSTGDSGSPLMVKGKAAPDKYHIEGILSFVKGCDQFEFGESNEAGNAWKLIQRSENPTTYTKLSCFIPWIAAQYNMEYEHYGSLDQACYTGSGDPQDVENLCRNTHSNHFDFLSDIEVECKFPFYYNGKKYDECILLDEEDFVYPIFRCPIRDITTKIDGINSFEFSSLVEGICLSDYENELSELDPTKECVNIFQKRSPFSQCKNNCPGVRAFGIVGGGAVLAGIATTSVLGLGIATLAGLGTLGTLGLGGSFMIAQSMCAGPLYCISVSGKCCLVFPSNNGLVCPDTC